MRSSLEGVSESDIQTLTANAVESQLPVNVLRAFLFNAQGTPNQERVQKVSLLCISTHTQFFFTGLHDSSHGPKGRSMFHLDIGAAKAYEVHV